MLFGKAPSTEEVNVQELHAYLDRCFNEKLKRLSTRIPEIEKRLSASFSDFWSSLKRFSELNTEPDMEYLYGIKVGYVTAQRPNYSNALLHLQSTEPQFGGNTAYAKGESILKYYREFINKVLRTNNKFRLVMVAYAKDIGSVKSSFESVEKLCKDLENEMNYCSPQLDEYNKVQGKIADMLDNMGKAATLEEIMSSGKPESSWRNGPKESELHERIAGAKRSLNDATVQYNNEKASLTSLLSPIERLARKHDYTSKSKKRLSDYITNPMSAITDEEDVAEMDKHLSEIREEINTEKINLKNAPALISQINEIKGKDILALVESARGQAEEVNKLDKELARLEKELKKIEAEKQERDRILAEKGAAENAVKEYSRVISLEKNELERLFLEHYKKRIRLLGV